jgi:hypothetical protein
MSRGSQEFARRGTATQDTGAERSRNCLVREGTIPEPGRVCIHSMSVYQEMVMGVVRSMGKLER